MLALIAKVNLSGKKNAPLLPSKVNTGVSCTKVVILWCHSSLSIMNSNIQWQGIYIGLVENEKYTGRAIKYVFLRRLPKTKA